MKQKEMELIISDLKKEIAGLKAIDFKEYSISLTIQNSTHESLLNTFLSRNDIYSSILPATDVLIGMNEKEYQNTKPVKKSVKKGSGLKTVIYPENINRAEPNDIEFTDLQSLKTGFIKGGIKKLSDSFSVILISKIQNEMKTTNHWFKVFKKFNLNDILRFQGLIRKLELCKRVSKKTSLFIY